MNGPEHIKELVRNAPRLDADVDARPNPPDDYASVPTREFKLRTAAELGDLPPLSWSIQSIFPRTGVAAVFGASGAAKTFVVLGMVAACGAGAEWFGYRTSGDQRWIYVGLEGQAGIQPRVRAWEKFNGQPFPEGVRFVFEPFNLTVSNDVLALAKAIEAAGGADGIVIDTFNRATPGADENSSSDMGLILEAVRSLQGMTGGLVVLVHHSGKNLLAGMRGHSSLFAALDAAIEVTRTDDRRELRVAKVKDGEDGATHPFRLQVVEIGTEDDGDPITSCVVVLNDDGSCDATPRVKLPKGGNQKIVLDALRPLFRQSHTLGRGGAPAVRPCLVLDDAVTAVCARLTVEPKRRRERTLQAITGLVAASVLGSNEGWIWLV